MSLSELRQKDVINTRDGQCLGKPMDIEFCALDGNCRAGGVQLCALAARRAGRGGDPVGEYLQDWR